jgi:hypothetical protein
MDQVSLKYTIIFHCKTLQNLPKFGFLVWKQTIWQPCLNHFFAACLQRQLSNRFQVENLLCSHELESVDIINCKLRTCKVHILNLNYKYSCLKHRRQVCSM